ncbi:hypothetical protein PAEPH01_0434 [Pancytospora epiphaga]|nr:hypothetical protein PAEPH01_0434 [Pancytospora epiphaga]
MSRQSDSEENPYRVDERDFTAVHRTAATEEYSTWDEPSGTAQNHNEFKSHYRADENNEYVENEGYKDVFFAKKVGFEVFTFCNGSHNFPGNQGR